MDFKELVKKYWFVGVLAIVLIAFIGVYAMDAYNNREVVVSGKTVDGKDVVYSVDGENVFADDFYNSLYDLNGLNCEVIGYQRAILGKSYETTDEMNQLAANYASYMYQNYGKEYVLAQLQAMGYVNGTDDLAQYYIDSQKRNLLIADYAKANESTYITPFVEENSPRVIYHILVKVADVKAELQEDGTNVYTANPTEEEAKKLQDVLNALKTKSFQEVAVEYSDDSSGAYGGLIGCISNKNKAQYYTIFSTTSMALGNDEVSEPVTSQAGYHIIWNAGSSTDTLIADSEFLAELEESYPSIGMKAIVEKGNELGFEIVDEQLQNFVNQQLESGDAQ